MPEKEKNEIQKLYDDPKSKKFVNHLVQAYLPVYKSKKIWEFKKGQKHRCNVCGQKLLSVSEYMAGVHQKFNKISEDFGDFIKKKIVDGEQVTREEHPIVKHVIGDKILGWEGEQTDTTLCLKCIQDLLNLVQMGLLYNDKNLIWLTKKMQRSQLFDYYYNSEKINNEEKNQVKEIHHKIEKKKVVTFGDLQVLKDLKKKLEEDDL